jgi:hypothetical protein
MNLRRFAVLVVSAGVVSAGSLSACANQSSSGAGDQPISSPSFSIPAEESPSVEAKTLTGTITAGVEPGCLLLDNHLLIFKNPTLKAQAKAGTKVTVTGKVQEGMMSTCMQGTPFEVTSLQPAQ